MQITARGGGDRGEAVRAAGSQGTLLQDTEHLNNLQMDVISVCFRSTWKHLELWLQKQNKSILH